MRLTEKRCLLAATLWLCAAIAVAQSSGGATAPANPVASKPASTAAKPKTATNTRSTTAAKKPATRSECVEAAGLCVLVPATWQRLGDIFDDLGFVVAEPHAGVDSALWPQVNVAAIDVPPEETTPTGAPSLDAVVRVLLTPDGTFRTAETQQRTRLLLNGAEAQVLKVLLRDDAGNTSQEEVALIDGGDEGFVYTIALRCAPEEYARLEPVFQRILQSWRVKPDDGADAAAGKADAAKATSATPAVDKKAITAQPSAPLPEAPRTDAAPKP